MKSFTRVALIGASGIVLFKLFTTVLFPVMALIIGLVTATVKLALVAAVVYFVWTLFWDRNAKEAEIVVDE